VAVATVGATAGVAAASSNTHTGILSRLGVNLGRFSTSAVTCTACWESSSWSSLKDSGFTIHKSGSNWQTTPGDFYFFFTAHNLSAGFYVITVTPDFSASPFQYSTNGNNAFLFKYDTGQAVDCPNFGTDSHGNPNPLPSGHERAADTVPHLFTNPSPGAYHLTSAGDLQLAAHFKWNKSVTPPSGTTQYTFTGAIYATSDLVHPICSAPITVSGTKTS
jgi:hypothetical protein